MNQQLIFNGDYGFDPTLDAVTCTVLLAGLRLNIRIRRPEGWPADAWLSQVRDDAFFWEDEIEQAIRMEHLDADGTLWIDGAAS